MTKTNTKILYAIAFAAIGAIVLAGVYNIDAQAAQPNKTVTSKTEAEGPFLSVGFFDADTFGSFLTLPLTNDEDTNFLFYQLRDRVSPFALISFGSCFIDAALVAPSDDITSVDVNTADLDCSSKFGPDGTILLEFVPNDNTEFKFSSESKSCFPSGATLFCFESIFAQQSTRADVTGSALGIIVDTPNGSVGQRTQEFITFTIP